MVVLALCRQLTFSIEALKSILLAGPLRDVETKTLANNSNPTASITKIQRLCHKF